MCVRPSSAYETSRLFQNLALGSCFSILGLDASIERLLGTEMKESSGLKYSMTSWERAPGLVPNEAKG